MKGRIDIEKFHNLPFLNYVWLKALQQKNDFIITQLSEKDMIIVTKFQVTLINFYTASTQ
jgi:hypothetical protein